ncbi:ATP-binding protein [Reyranella sp.]|uniref:ATP-binding protein n=1 Tax=Reyranella sp. TaxID=1929291 RepID=UPI003782D817
MSKASLIKPRERDVIVQALRAGVVPKLGLRHIQVGRAREVEELIKDVDRVASDGATIRFVIGDYGAGKTFFLNLIRLIALERKLVVMNADLAPSRRLHATDGQARSLFNELARNTSTRTKPEGGALASIVERFVGDTLVQAKKDGKDIEEAIQQKLAPLRDLVSGFDFATVLARYTKAYDEGDEAQKTASLRWLRAEYSTRTEARAALGVRDIIDDERVYDYLKLYGAFVRLAGYGGLLVLLDEMVNLYKLTHAQARNANYEQILRILNDVLQGGASGIGFLMGGTPEFLMDTRRGLYSYSALQSRLAENRFAQGGLVDLSGPILRLQNLTPEDLYILLTNIRTVFAGGDQARHLVPDDALMAFMKHCSLKIGDAYFRTPRNTVTAFVNLLSVLEQNPGSQWQSLLDGIEVTTAIPEEADGAPTGASDAVQDASNGDQLTAFKL